MVSYEKPFYRKHKSHGFRNQEEGDGHGEAQQKEAKIDYILISKTFREALLSAKTYPGADCYNDHVPVGAKILK